ncbi:MAG: DUF4954 family protein, partial [Sedimentisphaerales bacterium]|nr:DUF4954 family protein [Sedimentisphaerales bacterium]
MPEQYRPLTHSEIEQLHNRFCTCSDWSNVQVGLSFKPEYIRNTHFSGRIRIGNNVRIACVHNQIANYEIGDNVLIENVGTLAVSGTSSFGNGTRVVVINEAGGREVPIYNTLTAQIAALLALYRNRPLLIEKLCGMIDAYAASVSSDIGYIAAGASIVNTTAIINVNIGDAAIINGATRLENGTINSSASDPAFVGAGVCAKNFIACSGSRLDEHAVVHNCFVGQAVRIERHFSAENCLFFANCVAALGEACSVFAGPYTVTHHKSTLLLAGLFSFFNAGSGTNQSNHLYKLGPVHQGVLERGCKTGSNAYLVWPARVGAFSTVIGSHYLHFDTSSMPFSYLLEEKGRTVLVPGTAIKGVGIVRDEQKWIGRDNRKDPHTLDLLIFETLSPYTMQNIISGRNQLENIRAALKNAASESVQWNNLTIKLPALTNGIHYYGLGITRYLGEQIIERLKHQNVSGLAQLRDALVSQIPIGRGRWLDLVGLIAPEEAFHKIIADIETQAITTLDSLAKSFKALYDNYVFHKWRWTAALLEDTLATSIDKILPDDIIGALNDYKSAVEKLNGMILEDTRKEFDASIKVGYGTDGESAVRDADFDAVRGKFENNTFVKR